MKRILAALTLLFAAATAFGAADDFPSFVWRNPTPEGGSLNAVIYANGAFMAGGVGGRILTSADGSTWAAAGSMTTETVNSLAYGASTYVAVGGSGQIFSSVNGATWTQRFTINNGWWNAVTFADNRFVAVGDNGNIATSLDGTTWTQRTSNVSSRFSGVAGTTGRYVAVSQDMTILTSTDATTWSTASVPGGFSGNSLNGVSYVNGQFVIASNNGMLLTGTNGTTWVARNTSASGAWFNSIAYNGTVYLATGSSSDVLTSTDLVSFTRTVLPTAANFAPFLASAAGASTFAMVGPGGEIWTSTDGVAWTSRGNSGGGYRMNDVRYLNGKFVAGGTGANIYTSADGLAWSRTTGPNGFSYNAAAYGAGLYVIASDFGGMLSSPDATTWTTRSVTDSSYASGVTFGNGLFVAVGQNGLVRTSADGMAWTTPAGTGVSGSAFLRSVTSLGNTFVAVGDNGAIYTSTNGTAWTARTSGVSDNLNQVRVVDGCLFALGNNRTLLASANGTTWVKLSLPNDYPNLGYALTDIVRLQDGFYVSSSQGLLIKSPDLVSWSKASQLAYSENLTALATDGTHLVAAGFGLSILESHLPSTGAAPAIAVAPLTQTLLAGNNVVLSVIATGTGPLSYQWQKGGTNISGATSAVLILPNAQTTDTGSYTVVVSGPGGSPVTSAAGTLTVNPVVAPTIASLPVVAQAIGFGANITVTASGTSPLSYQWYHGASGDTSNLIAGATSTTLNVSSATVANTERYWVRVSNTGGSVDSPTTSVLAFAGRNGFSATSGLNGVAFGNGIYVAAGWNNVLLSSPDGVTWTPRSGPSGSSLKAITFGGGTFVAVGFSGAVRTSTDGITWATPTSGTNNNLNAVCYDGSQFIAVGDNSTILTSSNGSTWTAQTADTASLSLLGVAFGTGGSVTSGYVAVASNGAILSAATSGSTWTSRTSNTSNSLNGVTFASSKFVAVGNNGTVRTSTDGVSWTTQTSGTGNSFNAVTFGGSQFLAVAGSGYFTSSDGVTWSTFTSFVSGGGSGMNAVVFANSQWVVAGFPGQLFTSPSAAAGSWTLRNGFLPFNVNDAIYANGRYFTASDNGVTATSVDGVTYNVFSPAVAGVTQSLKRLAYGNGTFLAVGSAGTILSSTDGLTWSNRTFGSTSYFATAFGAGRFVVAGANGTFATSLDGVTWTAGAGSIGSAQVNAIEYAPSLSRFVAVNLLGNIYTSSDGLSWAQQTSPASGSLQHVLFAGGKFVAVGVSSTVLTSADGLTWTTQNLGTAGISLTKVAYGDGIFIATHSTSSSSSLLFISRDGVTWNSTSVSGGVVNQFNATEIAYGNGAFLIAGPGGLISQSVPATDTLRISTQPVAQNVASGASGTFSVTTAGGGTVTYQWYRGVTGDTSTPVGTNSSSFTTSVSARYWVRVTSGTSTVDSTGADLIAPAPTINTQPSNVATTAGTPASFTVNASSSNGTPTYQWRRNGTNLTGQTSATLAFGPAQQGQADLYDVVVSLGASSVTSNTVRLTVAPQAFPGLSKLDTAFNLNIESDALGQLNVVVPYGSTQFLAAGEFIRLDGSAAMRRLARFNNDGTLDGSFVVNTNGPINAVVVLPLQSGETLPKIVIGGSFTQVNGTNRSWIVRLNGDGTLDNTFNVVSGSVASGPNSTVNAIVAAPLQGVETLPRLLVGGSFSSYNGATANRLIKLNTDGTPDGSFLTGSTQGVGNTINAIAIDTAATGGAAGRFVAVGSFNTLGNGNAQNRVARFNADGSFDSTFAVGTGADNTVNAVAIDASSRVLIGGSFQNYFTASTPAVRFARLTASGGLDLNFIANQTVNAIYIEDNTSASSNILIGGSFTTFGSGATAVNRLARVSSAGVLDGTFNPNVNSTVLAIFKQSSDSKVVVGGSFSTVGNNPARLVARVDGTTGARDTSLLHNFRAPGTVHKILPLPDGKLLITGAFTHFGTTPALNMARLNANLTLDVAYAPAGGSGYAPGSSPTVTVSGGGAGSGAVITANVRATDGQVANFTITNGGSGYTSAPTITIAAPAGGVAARATAVLTSGVITAVNLDSSLAGPNGAIRAAVVDGPGRIVIAGQFTSYNGTNVSRVARLNSDLTLDTTFNPGGAGANNDVNAILAIPGGGYYIGGSFSNYNNATPARANVARLFADGTLNAAFSGGTSSTTINALALDGAGKLVVGGNFTTLNGQSRTNIARFSPDGSVDAVMTSTSTSNQVRALLALPGDAGEPNGRVVVGGDFTNLLGTSLNRLGRVKASDGTVDTSFAFNATLLNNSVFALLRQEEAAGRVLAWGNFNGITVGGGLNNNWLIRVNGDGTVDPSLGVLGTTLSNNLPQPSALYVLDDGSLLVGTNSVTLSNQERTGLLRLVAATPPAIIALSANAVRPGATITLTGTDFTDVTAVRFGGANGVGGTFTVNSATSITVTVPANAPSGPIFVQTLYGTATSAAAVGVAPDFQRVNPALSAGSLENIAFGNGTYVIAGLSGTIWSSTDGATWTKRFSAPNQLNGVTFAASQFVAVGNSGTIVTSPDGVTWTPRPLVGTNVNLTAAAYDGARWVVVTSNATVVTSTDGANWNFFSSTGGNSANGLAVGAGVLVSVGNSGAIRTSSNGGLNWTTQTSNAGTDTLNDVVFVNGNFLVGGSNGRIVTSPDGTTWTSRASGGTTAYFAATYGSIGGTSKYIMGAAGQPVASTDLITWTTVSGVTSNPRTILFAGGQFVAAGNQGNLGTSPDGVTWTLRTSAGQRQWRDFAYGAGRYVAVGDGASYASSTDGTNFTFGTNATGSSANLNGVAYGNGLFVAVGVNVLFTTPDGVTWTSRTPSGAPTFNSVAYGNGAWVAVASSGAAYRSTDGVTFTQVASTGVSVALNNITYGGSPAKFVAVGASNGTSGTIITSPDGTTWTTQVSNAGNNNLNGVTFAAGKFVALGANSTLVTSPDGVTWTLRSIPTAGLSMTRVAYGDGYFVAVANTANNFLTSTDAVTWNLVSPSLEAFNTSSGGAITYGNGHFVVGAALGFFATTNPASDTTLIATQPAGSNFTSGQSVTLNVGANGTGLTYQWYNGFTGDTSSPVSGQTSSTFNTGSLTASARYWVRVTDGSGATVDSPTTTLLGPPAITTNPVAQSVNEGSNVTFSVAAFGSPTLNYQWRRNGANFSDANATGTNSASMTITGVTAAQAGSFDVVVSNTAGSNTSATAALSVLPVAPTIAQQSGFGQGVIALAGSNVDLQVTVTGTQPITVQWKKNGVNVGAPVSPDSSGIAHLIFLGMQQSDQGPYTAIATNSIGSSPEIPVNQAQFIVNQPAFTWRQSFPTPVSLTAVSVAHDGGFHIFGNRGYFADSDDGQNWSQSVGLTTQTMNGYVFGNNRHLFWASQFFASAKVNGADLVKSHLPSFETVNEVTFGQGLFVAICSSGKIFTSPDGVTWLERTSNTTESLFEMTFGNGMFAASTASGLIITSADGMTWSAPHASPSNNVQLLRYANGLFYLGNTTGQLYSSADTVNWTTLIGTGGGQRLGDLAYTTGHYVIVGNGGLVLTSTNGTTWTPGASGVTTNLLSVAYDNGNWVAVGGGSSSNTSVIVRSTDNGATWIKQNGGNTTAQLNGVTSSATALVTVGNSGVILRSSFTAPDTAADAGWGWQTSNNGGNTSNLNEVAYAGTTFWAVGSSGTIRTSTDDGLNWSTATSGTSNNLFWVGSLKGQLSAAGASGTLLAFNGTTWNAVATGSSAQLNGAAYGLVGGTTDTYVLVGNGGAILTSATGAASSWTATTSGTANLNEVVFGNGKFVAVGDNGTIITSTNGTSWTSTGFGLPENFTHVGFTSGIFIVSGSTSGVFTSSDGTNWIPRLGGTNGTAFIRATSPAFGGRVYGVGTGGAILGSDLIPQIENVTVGAAVAGGPATFRADFFEPLLPVTFQWNKGGFPIAGANGPTYTIPSTNRADAGLYDVTLTTTARDTGSDPVLLAVAPTSYPGLIAADPSWDPNPITISTRSFAALKLPNGKWIVGGESVRWDNQPRTALARLNADLTLDTSWTPPLVNGVVYALAATADGNTVYFGGEFSAVDGHSRPSLARLITVGGNLVHDLAWRPLDALPTASTQVSALAVQDNNQLLVARQSFITGVIGGTNVIRRLNVDGTQDGSFSVNLTVGTGPQVTSLIAEPGANPAIAFAGNFSQVNATGHARLARVDNTGATVDANFGGSTGANGTVNNLTRLSDGRYIVVGNFGQVGGLGRNHIAVLTAATGAVDTTFVSATTGTTNGNIHAATVLSDGRIVAVGNFTQYAGTTAAAIVRLNGTTGAVDSGYTIAGSGGTALGISGAGRNAFAFTLANDKVALIGTFSQMLGARRVATAVIDGAVSNTDAADPAKSLLAVPASLVYRPAFTNAAFLEADGKLTVFGSIDAANGAATLGQTVRIKPDGTVDSTYPGGAGFGLNGLSTFGIYRGTRQADGKYVVTGDFVTYNGSTANRLVRINQDGSIDSSFNAGAGPSNYLVTPYALAGGKTLLFGSFGTGFTYNTATVSGNLLRVDTNGTRDTGLNTGAGFNGTVSAVVEVPDPNAAGGYPVIVAGSFTTYNGVAAPGMVAIDGNGARLTDFDGTVGTGPSGGGINGFAITQPGRVLTYGSFTTFNGTPVNRLVVLNIEDGGIDPTFAAAAAVDSAVTQAIVQEDGKVIVVGEFSSGPALRLNANGTLDPTFALRGATGFPGGSSAVRLILADDGSLYAYNGMVSMANDVARALVHFKGAATAPVIAIAPASGPIQTGVNNLLWVRAGGTGPYTYQWYKNGNLIGGATDSVLVIPNATNGDAGSYTVAVTGPGGSVTSNAATLSLTVMIADQPTGRRAVEGNKVVLRVSGSTTLGTTLTYQWYKNNGLLGGATSSDLTLPSVTVVDAATYKVVVGDGTNTITSQDAVVTVMPADNVLWQSFTEYSSEQSPARTIHDGNGKVYLPWNVQSRNPDVAAGRLIGTLARFNESDGSLDPTFKLDRRYVRAAHAAVQTDGKVVIAVQAGDAATVIRVTNTGAVDTSFTAPLFVRGIRFITLQSDGKVLVATTDLASATAPATAIGGDAPSLYRLNTNGTLDGGFTRTVFSANANLFGPPVVDSSGNIYLAGAYSTVNGTARINIARLSSNGTLDANYAAPASLPAGFASGQARGVALQSDGRAVFVGDFRYTARGTQGDSIMAIRFSTAGAFDSGFNQPLRSAVGLPSGLGMKLRFLVINADDKIVAVSGKLVRLNADGSPDGTFAARTFGKEAFWISRGADGKFYSPDQNSVSGNATTLLLYGNGVARFAPDGTPDESFQTGGWGRSGYASSGAVLSDGRVWAAGYFNRYGSKYVPGVAQFDANGALTATQPTSTLIQSYATLASAGGDQVFTIMNSDGLSNETPASFFVRLNSNATVDNTFTPVLPSGYNIGSAELAASPGGKVIVFQDSIGANAALNGATGDALFRLNANGTRDTTFNATLSSFAVVERGAGNAITMIRTGGVGVGQVLADGRVLVGGAGIDGSLKIVRLLADGTVDPAFNAPSFGTITPSVGFTSPLLDPVTNTTAQWNISTYEGGQLVNAVLQTADGKVYVGGSFTLAGAPRGLVRLNANGTLDTSFTGTGIGWTQTDSNPYVDNLAVDSLGRIYVGGRFDSFNGTAAPGLFRLLADGTLDTANAWRAGFNVVDAPTAGVRLVSVGTKLYGFGTVGFAADPLTSAYRVTDIPAPPSITTPPSNVGVLAGGNATFTVAPGGVGPFTYQWFKNGTLIGGATSASYSINGVAGGDVASYAVAVSGPGGTTTTTQVQLAILTPPSITTQPLAQAVSSAASFTLNVGASGSPTLLYQWYKDSTPITGATSASYTVATATNTGTGSAGFGTTGDAGAYTVTVSNTVGNATSSAAVVTVLPPGFSATHAVASGGYLAGSTVTITNTFTYSGTLSALGWQVLLPPGWSFVSDSGASAASAPSANQTGSLEWAWITPPASGTTFTYTLNVPANATGQQTIAALYQPRQSGTQYTILAKPDPLTIDPFTYHSADTNHDFKISLTELLRVIELYNTKNGTVRTGAYDVATTTTEDGFVGDPARASTAVVTLAHYHSGDSNHDGKLSLTELLRVIELYNHRTGTVRDGLYHVQLGTEDNFGTGP